VFESEVALALVLALAPLEVAADDVLPAATPELPAEDPHPARAATTTAPARAAHADPNLLM
jgi:hypothetical protein